MKQFNFFPYITEKNIAGVSDSVFISIPSSIDVVGCATYPVSDYARLNGAYVASGVGSSTKIKPMPLGGLEASKTNNSLDYSIIPSISISFSSEEEKRKFEEALDIITRSFECGEYPQSIAPNSGQLEKLYQKYMSGEDIENFEETGKRYYGRYLSRNNFSQNPEFLYEGKKYVRVDVAESASSRFGFLAADGSNYEWCVVEPVEWTLAKKTFTNANGGSYTFEICTKQAIMSGLPFNKSIHPNALLWENSTPRGFLNGIDLGDEVVKSSKSKHAPDGGNFSGHGFIQDIKTEAYSEIKADGFDDIKEKIEKRKLEKRRTYTSKNLIADIQLSTCVNAGVSVFLHGPSGVGKSARVKQIDPTATRITLRPQMNPEEIDGTLNRETGGYIPPLWYTDLCKKCEAEPNRKHVLFIDELTNVKPTVQSLVYSIVLDRAGKDGLWPLPENAVVVAAGNESKDNLAANPLTNALFRRFSHVYYEVDKTAWLNWASGASSLDSFVSKDLSIDIPKNMHPYILEFVRTHQGYFYQELDEENPRIVTDPRKWEIASKLLYATHNLKAIEPAVGKKITEEFADFIQGSKGTSLLSLDGDISDDFENYVENANGGKNFKNNKLVTDFATDLPTSFVDDDDKKYSGKNTYGFTFDKLDSDQMLQGYINAGVSVFLHGASGVGKSARVRQIDPTATRITLRPQMNPEEIDGTLNRETGGYIPPLWYTDLCKKCEAEPNRKHVLFIDELTNVKPTVQSLVYSIVLDRAGKDGLWPLPENAVVVAAGNEASNNLAAEPMTNALFRRFSHIYFNIDVNEWLKWGIGVEKEPIKMPEKNDEIRARVHPAIYTYIKCRPESILNQELDEEDPRIVTDPRKWQIASDVLYATKNPYALLPAIGRDLTADFVDFVASAKVTPEDILEGRVKPREFYDANISTKLSNIAGLVDVDEKDLRVIRDFVSKGMGAEALATFDSLWIKNDVDRALIMDEVRQGRREAPKQTSPFKVVEEEDDDLDVDIPDKKVENEAKISKSDDIKTENNDDKKADKTNDNAGLESQKQENKTLAEAIKESQTETQEKKRGFGRGFFRR